MPRAVLFMEGQHAETVFIVTAGLSNLFRLLPDGRRQIVGFALPGDFLGLPRSSLHAFSATAACSTTTCCFSHSAFSELVHEYPGLLRGVYDDAVRRLDIAHDQMTILGQRRAIAKIAHFLVSQYERWKRIDCSPGLGPMPMPMSRQDIGDSFGMSISTVSRTLTRLARDGVITLVPHGVRIVDPRRLSKLAKVAA